MNDKEERNDQMTLQLQNTNMELDELFETTQAMFHIYTRNSLYINYHKKKNLQRVKRKLRDSQIFEGIHIPLYFCTMNILLKYLRPQNLFALRWLSSTVLAEEMTHFEALSKDWWDLEGSLRTLHLMNKVRIGFLMNGLLSTARITEQQLSSPKPLTSMKVLDAGCGGGILSEALARLGADVTGVDANKALIEVAKKHASGNPALSNINYNLTTMEEFCREHREEFDIVISSEVIEHLLEKESFLQSCVHTLKPGGSVVITTMTKTWLAYVSGIILSENIWKIIPKSTHHWNLFIKPKELKKILRTCGCSPLILNGHHYSLIRRSWFRSYIPLVFYAIFSIKN